MLRKLLVPLDGSELAETVLPWCLFLAREKRLTVALAQVIPGNGAVRAPTTNGVLSAAASPDVPGAELESAMAYLERVRGQLVRQGAEVEVAVRHGPIAHTLLDLADEIGASAIVLASHGLGGTPDPVLGGVTEQILQAATLPLLLVPAAGVAAARSPALRCLLVPLDGSPLAERALDIARELATESTGLLLLRAVEPVQRTLDTAEGHLPLEDAGATRHATEAAMAYLQRVRDGMSGTGVGIRTRVALGIPDRQILAVARQEAADLVVMVTHGTTGMAGGWLGSVANDVVRRTDVPVLLVSTRALVARVGRDYRVADVMTRDPVAVRVHEPLDVVLRRMLRRRISGAPVVGVDGTLVGIITEYDLLRWQVGAAQDTPGQPPRLLRDARVADVMSHLAVSIEESMPLTAVVAMLLELPYRRLPVTHGGRLVGIVSRADVLKAMAEQSMPTEDALVAAEIGIS